MNTILIQSIGFKAGIDLKDFIRKKAGKLFGQNTKIIRADITLYEEPDKNQKNRFCQIHLIIKGNNHVVKKNSGSYKQSTMMAIEALRKIIRRKKIQKISGRYKP